jgi:hypothetical protein
MGSAERSDGAYVAKVMYELSFKGAASDTVCALFDDFDVLPAHGVTVIRGAFADQASLYGALSRIHDLGLELLEVHLVASAESHDVVEWGPGDNDHDR